MRTKFPIMIHKTEHFELQQTNMKRLGNAGFRLWCLLASEWINSAANDISTRNAIKELITNGFFDKDNSLYDFFFWGGDVNETN